VPFENLSAHEHDGGDLGSSESFGIIQHTAATTGPAKGVRVTDLQVCEHIDSILSRIGPERGWRACSWLPLSHDMGLIGMLLASLVYGGSKWGSGGTLELMRPEDFVRRPWTWLATCSMAAASITAAPDFAYRLAVRHTARHPRLDLDPLTYAIVGGEMVSPETLSRFGSAFSRHGLSRSAIAPCYGMAEACLAVCMPVRGEGPTVEDVPAGEVLGDADGDTTLQLVSCGSPLRGVEVATRPGQDGVRQIFVAGPQIVTSYVGGVSVQSPDGFLPTGDAGAMVDGRLYVAGRLDDVLVVRGKNFPASRLEASIARRVGREPHLVAAFDARNGGIGIAMELDDQPNSARQAELREQTNVCCAQLVGVRPSLVEFVGVGELPRTSVGKLQRRLLTGMFT
jgi:acyl-CoA synthetase (AMP-forming)/AMP-acid ligase II